MEVPIPATKQSLSEDVGLCEKVEEKDDKGKGRRVRGFPPQSSFVCLLIGRPIKNCPASICSALPSKTRYDFSKIESSKCNFYKRTGPVQHIFQILYCHFCWTVFFFIKSAAMCPPTEHCNNFCTCIFESILKIMKMENFLKFQCSSDVQVDSLIGSEFRPTKFDCILEWLFREVGGEAAVTLPGMQIFRRERRIIKSPCTLSREAVTSRSLSSPCPRFACDPSICLGGTRSVGHSVIPIAWLMSSWQTTRYNPRYTEVYAGVQQASDKVGKYKHSVPMCLNHNQPRLRLHLFIS